MPDPSIETVEHEPSERRPYDSARPGINLELGYHPFVESEFEQGKGYCDQCGGGPDADIHQKPVDQMERIADSLAVIADALVAISNVMEQNRDEQLYGRPKD